MRRIYLDHNATTPARPEVVEAMVRCYRDGYANPASQHQPGQRARRALEEAKEAIAAILGAELSGPQADRLILTSGGTEANNLAILGIGRARCRHGPGQIIISAIEHASVIGPAEALLEQGWRLDTVGAAPHGVVRTERLAALLSEQTALVSVMLANHETGVLQPVAQIVQMADRVGVPVHTDAVQAAGKIPVHFRQLGVAAMSLAAHKFHGPLGIGALLLRHDVPIEPILWGGHQQGGLRPGTESVALAVGMWTALELWHKEYPESAQRQATLCHRLEHGLQRAWPDLVVHGSDAARLPQTSSVAFPGLDAQVLVTALDLAGVAASVGSACTSGSQELSPTLLAMGLPREVVAASIRFSLGTETTEQDIDEAVQRVLDVASALKG